MKTYLISLIILFYVSAFGAVSFTKGESPTLSLTAQNNGAAFTITGATIVTRFLKADGVAELEIADSAHTITSGTAGTFTVALAAADTILLESGGEKTIVSIVTLGGKEYYFWGRKSLTVYPAEIRNQ